MYDVSGRGVPSIARATAMAVALCLGAALTPAIVNVAACAFVSDDANVAGDF